MLHLPRTEGLLFASMLLNNLAEAEWILHIAARSCSILISSYRTPPPFVSLILSPQSAR